MLDRSLFHPHTRLPFSAAGATDVGRRRKRNEDAFLIDGDLGLYLVADGVGGHRSGDVAARLVAEHLHAGVQTHTPDLAAAASTPAGRARILRALEEVVLGAHGHVVAAAANDPHLESMATTLTAVLGFDGWAAVAHVGDSRLYRWRDCRVERLTADHSIVGELVQGGWITEEEAEKNPFRGVLTRAVGSTREDLAVDVFPIDLAARDVLLLCTDGIHRHFGDRELALRLADGSPADLVEELTRTSNERGGQDNATALVVLVGDRGSGLRNAIPGR